MPGRSRGTGRPWLAAVLQSAVNVGILLASVAAFLMAGVNPRLVFLVGVLPAWLVFWIRREVPEPAEWLLREWGQIDLLVPIDRKPAEGRRWYVNSQGQTMVVVPPGKYRAG